MYVSLKLYVTKEILKYQSVCWARKGHSVI